MRTMTISCDRCNVEIKIDPDRDHSQRINIDPRLGNECIYNNYDMCPNCFKELIKFLKRIPDSKSWEKTLENYKR